MVIHFTSDHHFWHSNIITYSKRPFITVIEMNEALIANWNNTVAPQDTVYYLGDFSMAIRPVETITPRLHGKKILIPGNHDFCHPAHKKGRTPEKYAEKVALYKQYGFHDVELTKVIEFSDIQVRLAHMPYQDPTYKDRHDAHKLHDDGMILLHGHVHDRFLTKRTANGTLMVNVGVDAPGAPWYMRPASMGEIAKVIKDNL